MSDPYSSWRGPTRVGALLLHRPDAHTVRFALCFAVTVTAVSALTLGPPVGVAAASHSAAAGHCAGDCDGTGMVSIAELIRGVGIALGTSSLNACPAFDPSGDGVVEINELIAAVDAALNGCPLEPTPTATLAATLQDIQQTIFSPRCAVISCHDSSGQQADLILEPDRAYAQLVGVPPTNGTADQAGLLRVDPGRPENSFLLVKLSAPGPGEGGRMPLGGEMLAPAELELIRGWIADGANP